MASLRWSPSRSQKIISELLPSMRDELNVGLARADGHTAPMAKASARHVLNPAILRYRPCLKIRPDWIEIVTRPSVHLQSSGSGLPLVSGAQIKATIPRTKMNESMVAAFLNGSLKLCASKRAFNATSMGGKNAAR